MSELDFDNLIACITKDCFCTEFDKRGCPDIKLECWEHAKYTGDCHCCCLCDFMNSLAVDMWKSYLPAIECNFKKCQHLSVPHSCAQCKCICSDSVKFGCTCSDCAPEYQEIPVSPPPTPGQEKRSRSSEDDETDIDEPDLKKVCIPYPGELLDDAIINMKVIRAEEYDMDEADTDFCSAKNPDPEYELPDPGPDQSVMEWDMWRPSYLRSYRPPAGSVFGGWADHNIGLKCKPEVKLYTHEEAVKLFCPLNMNKPDSLWSEDMCVSDMYEMALRCPCEEEKCVNILLRLRACIRLREEVKEAISALE